MDLAQEKLHYSKMVRGSSKIPLVAFFRMLVERFRVLKNIIYYNILLVMNKNWVKLIKYTTVHSLA